MTAGWVPLQMMKYNENLLLLVIDVDVNTSMVELPVRVFEAVVHASNQLEFVERPYKIETEDSERVAVDHVAKLTTGGSDVANRRTA